MVAPWLFAHYFQGDGLCKCRADHLADVRKGKIAAFRFPAQHLLTFPPPKGGKVCGLPQSL
jgi:hypothetical protein